MMEITIKAARINAGFSQTEAAKELGIGKSTLLNYEYYRTVPDINTALRMAELYGTTIDHIRWAE